MPDPSPFHANLQRGALLLNQNRPQEALPFLQAAIAANPDRPEGYAELARCWNGIPSQRWKSMGAINRAIALAPNVSFYHGAKAWYLVCLMRYRGALLAAQEGLALNPNCPKSLNGLANAYTKLGQWKKAEATCRRILADEPNDTPGLNLLAQALRHQGKWKETRQVVAQLLALTPNDAFGHANAGFAALLAGDHLRANEHFRESLRLDPHFDLARRGLLQSLRARIWIVRFNMRISNYVRRPATSRDLFWLFLIAFGILLAIAGFALGLDFIHPNAGTLFCGFLIMLLLLFFICLILWLYFSMVVGVFGNFLLLFDPLGRHALTRQEKRYAAIRALSFGFVILLCMCTAWPLALAAIILFLVLAFTTQFPLLRDRWLRRRLEQSKD